MAGEAAGIVDQLADLASFAVARGVAYGGGWGWCLHFGSDEKITEVVPSSVCYQGWVWYGLHESLRDMQGGEVFPHNTT